jgi:chaperone LolA
MRVPALAALAAIVLATVGFAARPAAASLQEAMRGLQRRYDETKTLQATFRQIVESPTLAGSIESEGRLAFEKPNRMRWDYDPPSGQVIVGDGHTLWIYQPDLKQVIKAPLSDAFESSTPVTFLGGLGRLDKEFDPTLESESSKEWVLKLVPRRDRAIGTLMLTVRKDDASIAEARITDPLGTTTRILLSEERRNKEIPADRFRFTPPSGVDVVQPPSY